MMDPQMRIKLCEIKKWLKGYENYVECKDWTNAHILAKKIEFWITRLPIYEKEFIERMNCNEQKTLHN